MRIAISVCLVSLIGCGGFGHVNQGRVVASERGLVTLVADSNYRDPAHPRFDLLPALTVRVPSDPREMGPEPEPGSLLLLDCGHGRAAIFDSPSGQIRTLSCAPVDERQASSGTGFPRVNPREGTISVYVPRERKIVTFSVSPEYRELPVDTWKFGDEVRYYYKDPLQALRMMNMTKTDFSK